MSSNPEANELMQRNQTLEAEVQALRQMTQLLGAQLMEAKEDAAESAAVAQHGSPSGKAVQTRTDMEQKVEVLIHELRKVTAQRDYLRRLTVKKKRMLPVVMEDNARSEDADASESPLESPLPCSNETQRSTQAQEQSSGENGASAADFEMHPESDEEFTRSNSDPSASAEQAEHIDALNNDLRNEKERHAFTYELLQKEQSRAKRLEETVSQLQANAEKSQAVHSHNDHLVTEAVQLKAQAALAMEMQQRAEGQLRSKQTEAENLRAQIEELSIALRSRKIQSQDKWQGDPTQEFQATLDAQQSRIMDLEVRVAKEQEMYQEFLDKKALQTHLLHFMQSELMHMEKELLKAAQQNSKPQASVEDLDTRIKIITMLDTASDRCKELEDKLAEATQQKDEADMKARQIGQRHAGLEDELNFVLQEKKMLAIQLEDLRSNSQLSSAETIKLQEEVKALKDSMSEKQARWGSEKVALEQEIKSLRTTLLENETRSSAGTETSTDAKTVRTIRTEAIAKNVDKQAARFSDLETVLLFNSWAIIAREARLLKRAWMKGTQRAALHSSRRRSNDSNSSPRSPAVVKTQFLQSPDPEQLAQAVEGSEEAGALVPQAAQPMSAAAAAPALAPALVLSAFEGSTFPARKRPAVPAQPARTAAGSDWPPGRIDLLSSEVQMEGTMRHPKHAPIMDSVPGSESGQPSELQHRDVDGDPIPSNLDIQRFFMAEDFVPDEEQSSWSQGFTPRMEVHDSRTDGHHASAPQIEQPQNRPYQRNVKSGSASSPRQDSHAVSVADLPSTLQPADFIPDLSHAYPRPVLAGVPELYQTASAQPGDFVNLEEEIAQNARDVSVEQEVQDRRSVIMNTISSIRDAGYEVEWTI